MTAATMNLQRNSKTRPKRKLTHRIAGKSCFHIAGVHSNRLHTFEGSNQIVLKNVVGILATGPSERNCVWYLHRRDRVASPITVEEYCSEERCTRAVSTRRSLSTARLEHPLY